MNDKLKEGETPLFDMDDKELIRFAYKMQNRFVMDTVAPEMTRRMILSIKKFNKESSKQSKRIFWLTIVMGIVALLQLIVLLK